MLTIYSLRWSFAKGDHWVAERQCKPDMARQWLAIFKADEPGVCFVAAAKKPKGGKNDQR
jgi:hypothetical protein